jgi:ribosomal protein L35AE/L33A
VTAQTGDYSFGQISGTVASGQLPSAGGDLSGALTNATVAKMQGRAISATAPTSGQVLTWSGTQWTAQAPTGGVTSTFGRTGAVTAQTGDYSFGQISGTVGTGQLPTIGGDLSGLLTSVTVYRIQNRAVSAAAPATGQVLMWDGAQWGPSVTGGVTSMFGRIGAVTAQTGDYSFAQISGAVGSGQLPTAAGDLSGALASPTVARIQNRPVGVSSPSTGQVLGWDGVQWTPQTVAGAVTSAFGRTGAVTAQSGDYSFGQISGSVAGGQLPAAGGDLSGTLTAARVTGLQSRPIATTVPATGQVLAWDGTQWLPQALSGVGVTSVFGRTGTVTAQTGDYSFAQVSGTVGSGQLPAAGGDLSGALNAPAVAGIQNRPVAATAPSVGQVLVWNGAQWTPQAQAGGVTSLFGRTGVVTGQTGDYSFPQISGTVASGQLPPVGGDVSGTLTSFTVSRLQAGRWRRQRPRRDRC